MRRNANIYAYSTSESSVLEHIDPSSSTDIILIVAGEILKNGYHNIYLPDSGRDGWIYKSRVRRYEGFPDGYDAHATQQPAYGGNPDTSNVLDYMTYHFNTGYAVGYSETKWNPLWSAYYVGEDENHDCARLRRFNADNRTLAHVTHDDYTGSGYDRGHMAPSHNIGSRYGCNAQDETYFMSNIAPQIPLLNQRPWGALEQLVSNIYSEAFDGVWVITGPIFDLEWVYQLCSGVEIPVAFYKIIIREIGGNPDVLAVIFNQDTQPDVKLENLVVSVDEIEERTGLNFLHELPDAMEDSIEATKATSDDWLLDTDLDTNFRPGSREFCKLDRIKRDEFIYDY